MLRKGAGYTGVINTLVHITPQQRQSHFPSPMVCTMKSSSFSDTVFVSSYRLKSGMLGLILLMSPRRCENPHSKFPNRCDKGHWCCISTQIVVFDCYYLNLFVAQLIECAPLKGVGADSPKEHQPVSTLDQRVVISTVQAVEVSPFSKAEANKVERIYDTGDSDPTSHILQNR